MLKRLLVTAAVLALFGFTASNALAGHGRRGPYRHHGRQPVLVGHGYQYHGSHIDRVDTYVHGRHIDTVRHHGRPVHYRSYQQTQRYYRPTYRGYYNNYPSYRQPGFGFGVSRPGVSFYFGW